MKEIHCYAKRKVENKNDLEKDLEEREKISKRRR